MIALIKCSGQAYNLFGLQDRSLSAEPMEVRLRPETVGSIC